MASGQDLVKIAQAESGTKESGTNNVKYNTWFYGHEVDGSNYPWCAVFVSWCADKAGITTDIMPKTASAGYFAHYANQGHGEVFTNKNPEAGDLFLINYNGSDWANHVGIVASCDGSNITTIEGNSSDMVRSRTLSMSGLTFVHFNLDSSSGMTTAWTAREVPNIGRDLATKAYMAYQLYTDKSSGGYSYLWGSNSTTANGGLRKYKEFYCVAMGSYYGPDGTFIKVEFDDGKTIYCVKADEKKDSETDSKHMYHDYPFDRNVLEFIIDRTVVRNNDEFTSALNAAGINRSARIKAIWTSDSEPTYGGAGSTTAENEKEYHFIDTNEKISIHPTIFKQTPMQCDRHNGGLTVLCNDIDISSYVGDISWQNTKDTLATLFNFSVPKAGDMKYINMYKPQEGDIIRYSGGTQEDFRGVIIEVDDGDNYVNKYVAGDVGQYLNKTSDTYQFTAMRADDCIKKICGDLCIPIVMIPELPLLITQIYVDKAVSDVIADILTLCGGVHNFDFVPDGIRIYNCADMVVNPQFRISSNTELKDSIKYIGNVEHKTSIEDRKTSVKVISDTDVLTTLKDENSIAQFGFLQEVIKVGENEDAKEVAKNKLSELNNTSETYSGEIIEELNSYTRAGSVIAIGDEKYLINSSQHSIKQGVHYNKLDLERL